MTAPTDRAAVDAAAIEGAMAVADTVLFEGYMLYPYRANDPKNLVRWQFGVLMSPAFVAADPSEHALLQTDCLVEGHEVAGGTGVTVSVQVRFLHVQRRTVEQATADGSGRTMFAPTGSLDLGDTTYLPWDEAVVHESLATVDLAELDDRALRVELQVAGAAETEILRAAGGDVVGRLVRRREPLVAALWVEAEQLPGPFGVRRVRLRLQNETPMPVAGGVADRPAALRHALVAAHLLVSVNGGAFISLIDPPEWARDFAEGCQQVGAFPVLAGPPGYRKLVLASPIILYDHPQVAPESVSQFCDATEMDEMLTLRTMTLTDEELRQVRGSDPRGAALVDQLSDLPGDLMERLHGAIRSMSSVAHAVGAPAAAVQDDAEPADGAPPWWDPVAESAVDPDSDFVFVNGVPVGRGTAVRLRPGPRLADAQDMFLEGRTARVEAVLSDVDGGSHLAVTLDDLAEDGYNPHGRFLYFAPDEVEPIGVDG